MSVLVLAAVFTVAGYVRVPPLPFLAATVKDLAGIDDDEPEPPPAAASPTEVSPSAVPTTPEPTTSPDPSPGRRFPEFFTDPLVRLRHLLLPAVRDPGEALRRLRMLALPSDLFFSSGEHVAIRGVRERTLDRHDLQQVSFEIEGRPGTAWSYLIRGPQGAGCATLTIPGSGMNQSLNLMRGLGYQGRVALELASLCDSYVLIKPNEDARSIHDGHAKLNSELVLVDLLNRGASYSATYLIEAVAATRALQRSYETVGVIGVSQGGHAALLTSLQTEPAFAVVASGYSVIAEESLRAASSSQIILPGLDVVYDPDGVLDVAKAQATGYLFTYGRAEDDYYGLEAARGTTCRRFAALGERISCHVHPGGHQFDIPHVVSFVSAHLESR